MSNPGNYVYLFWWDNLTSVEPQQVLFAMVLDCLPSAKFAKRGSFIRC